MKTYHLQELYREQDLLILLVSASRVYVDASNSNVLNSFYGNIQPAWIVIKNPQEVCAVNMQVEQIPLDEVCKVVPKLKSLLNNNSF